MQTTHLRRFEGTYETDYGPLRLHQDGSAVFGDYKHVGVIDAQFDETRGEATGTFTNGDRKGRLSFQLTDDGLQGKWAWDDQLPKHRWNGTKTSWATPDLSTYETRDRIRGTNNRALIVLSMLNVRSTKFRKLYQFLDDQGIKEALRKLGSKYAHIHTLRDRAATLKNYTDQLAEYAQNADIREIDVMIHRHGYSSGNMGFADQTVTKTEMEDALTSLGIGSRLRMFYTTACYGSKMLTAVTNGGFTCAAGARAINANSPTEFPEFLLRWGRGQSFGKCIDESYNPARTKGLEFIAKLAFSDVDSKKNVKGDRSITISSTKG